MGILDRGDYDKALVLGAGSGRDMASCILLTQGLREQGIVVDLAGFLTPWALHTFGGRLERPVNELTGKRSRKFIASRQEVSLDSYFEPELKKLNTELGLGVGSFYLFSLQYGTQRLRSQLESLIKKNSYDVLIALDVGGDILARKKDYPWLLTPIVDFSCLTILGGLRSDIDCYLTVAAPGVDGEIPCENLMEIFDELESKGLVLSSDVLVKGSKAYQAYRSISNSLNLRTGSNSNTFRLIEKVVSSKRARMSETLKKTVSLGERRWTFSFPLDLSLSLAKRVYYFDLKSIHAMRDISFGYDSVLEAFVKLRQLGAGGTEVDLSFVPRAMEGGGYKDTVFLLTPPQRVRGKKRKAMLEHGIRLTGQGVIPYSMILEEDASILSFPPSLQVVEADRGFCALYQSRNEQARAKLTRISSSATEEYVGSTGMTKLPD
jgi:hypothetical protein